VKFVVSNKKVILTDECSSNCKYSWSRITTFSLKELAAPKEDPATEP